MSAWDRKRKEAKMVKWEAGRPDRDEKARRALEAYEEMMEQRKNLRERIEARSEPAFNVCRSYHAVDALMQTHGSVLMSYSVFEDYMLKVVKPKMK